MFGTLLDQRQLVNRLRVVGDRAIGIDRDGHRSHAEESEGHQPKANTGGEQHQRPPGPSVLK